MPKCLNVLGLGLRFCPFSHKISSVGIHTLIHTGRRLGVINSSIYSFLFRIFTRTANALSGTSGVIFAPSIGDLVSVFLFGNIRHVFRLGFSPIFRKGSGVSGRSARGTSRFLAHLACNRCCSSFSHIAIATRTATSCGAGLAVLRKIVRSFTPNVPGRDHQLRGIELFAVCIKVPTAVIASPVLNVTIHLTGCRLFRGFRLCGMLTSVLTYTIAVCIMIVLFYIGFRSTCTFVPVVHFVGAPIFAVVVSHHGNLHMPADPLIAILAIRARGVTHSGASCVGLPVFGGVYVIRGINRNRQVRRLGRARFIAEVLAAIRAGPVIAKPTISPPFPWR